LTILVAVRQYDLKISKKNAEYPMAPDPGPKQVEYDDKPSSTYMNLQDVNPETRIGAENMRRTLELTGRSRSTS